MAVAEHFAEYGRSAGAPSSGRPGGSSRPSAKLWKCKPLTLTALRVRGTMTGVFTPRGRTMAKGFVYVLWLR